jgi:hypothetical protein
MAHHVGSSGCDAELEMVVSFVGRPPEAERDRELDPASRPSQDSA